MRLATILHANSHRLVAGNDRGEVYLLDELLRSARDLVTTPKSMLELIQAGPGSRVAEAVTRGLHEAHVRPVVPQAWLPPLPNPGKILGVAVNNAALANFAFRYFEKPAFFMKAPSSLVGSGQAIRIRREYGLTHPEPELACIIGTRMNNLDEAHVLDGVFGYTILNDVTSIGMKDEDSLHFEVSFKGAGPAWRRQKSEDDSDIYLTYHARSKCTDTFGPLGPWLVTAGDIPNPNDLTVRAWMGENLILEDSTRNLMFGVQKVLSHLSRYITLEPGDIVHMGTAVDPLSVSLRAHDLRAAPGPVSIEIEGLGRLVNPIELFE